jgi:hypothetical protein
MLSQLVRHRTLIVRTLGRTRGYFTHQEERGTVLKDTVDRDSPNFHVMIRRPR